jgi:protein-disulfide isomerase
MPDIAREIDTNLTLARTLGLTGTPSWVIGDRVLSGAVGYDELKKTVAEARAKKG